MRRGFAVSLVVLCLGSACASGDHLDPAAAQDLGTQIESIRTMAEGGERYKAKQAVLSLIDSVQALKEDGTVGEERAARILVVANDVLENLALLPAPAVTESPSPSVEPPVSEEGEGSDDHSGHGGEHGNGEDKGKKVGHDKD